MKKINSLFTLMVMTVMVFSAFVVSPFMGAAMVFVIILALFKK